MPTSTTGRRRRVRTRTGEASVKSSGLSVGTKRARFDASRLREDSDAFKVDSDDATRIVGTPYDLQSLARVREQSNILPQCIGAMVTNIASHGFKVVPIREGIRMQKQEEDLLSSFVESANVEESLTTVHSKVIDNYEAYGFAFYELVRNMKGQPSLLKAAKSSNIRLTSRQTSAIEVSSTVYRNGRRQTVREFRRLRRYVQQIGTNKTYFKEFGDPRRMSYKTGKYEDTEYKVPKGEEATELLHRRQYSEDAYGLPRWISQLPSILGSRESEEVNLRYFEDNTVPPMVMTVAGGRLTRSSFQELKDMLERQGVGRERQNKILLLEAVPEVTDLEGKGSVQLKIEKLTSERPSDGLFKEYDDSNMAKVRSSFRLPPVVLGQSQDVTFACYDDQTETLTDSGWVTIDQWRDGMKVACYDKDTGDISFHDPENGILVYDVEDLEMYRIQSTQQDLLITPNHRMLSATKKDGEYVVEKIEDVADKSRSYFKTSGLYSKGLDYDVVDYFSVPTSEYHGGVAAKDEDIVFIPSCLFMEWLGCFIADGCITQRGCAIKIGAKKERKVLAFASLHEELEDYGFRVRISEEKAGTYYTISHKGMAQLFAEVAGDCSETKTIPNLAFGYSSTDLRVLFDALMFCDGTMDSREGRTSGSYSTVSRSLADSFQRLAVLMGYRTLLRTDRPGEYGVRPVYRILLSQKATCQILTSKHIRRETYTGRVYCFSVPTGIFVTRRNGKVAFQGNTANVSAYLAETQVFQPERKGHDEFLNKTFVNHPKGLGLKTVKLESRGPSITNPDEIVKSMTALNVMGALTPRKAVELANKALLIPIEQYPEKGQEEWEEWMDLPISIGQRTALDRTQQTGEGDHTDAEQSVKDPDTVKTEETGEVAPSAVEHGQE